MCVNPFEAATAAMQSVLQRLVQVLMLCGEDMLSQAPSLQEECHTSVVLRLCLPVNACHVLPHSHTHTHGFCSKIPPNDVIICNN